MVYDLAILVFPFILERIYTPLMASAPLGIPFIQVFITAMIYFLPFLIGSMYNNDFRDSPPLIKRFVPYVLCSCTLFAFINIMHLVMPGIRNNETGTSFVLITAIVFLIMGPMAGIIFTRKDSPGIKGESTQVFIFLFTTGMLPLFYMIIAGEMIFGKISGFAAFFHLIGLMVGDVLLIIILYLIYRQSRQFMIRIGAYDRLIYIMEFLAPFCVSFMLVFFNINSTRLFIGSAGVHSAGSVLLVFFLFIISGVLPLRVMMMLTPPVKRGNIVLGIISAVSMVLVIIKGVQR
jgi:hypothetical protein